MNLYEGIKNSLKESKYDDNYRGDDYWDLSDSYVSGNLSDNELADYLLNMYERPAAVKAFKEITDGKEFPKMEVPSSDIKEVSEEELHDFIMNWENDRTSVDRGRYIGKEGNKWVVIDNRTGDCWTEEFTNRGSALDYLNDKINADGSPYNEAEEKEYSDEEAAAIINAYAAGDSSKNEEAMSILSSSRYTIRDGYTKTSEAISNLLKKDKEKRENKKKDLKYGVKGSPESYIAAVADEMGVDLDSKVPFEMFYAPDSDYIDDDDEDNNEYWYDSDYDYADFYDKILHDMGYGENPVLNDCRAEVHEVSDGSYEMTLFYNGKEYTLDIDANDHMEQVKDNVDAIIDLLGRKAVKESESGTEEDTFLDMDLANYMLDNDIIIGAEYDYPEEYDDEHWLSLLGEALDLAKKENNADMISKINIAMDKINGAELNEAEEKSSDIVVVSNGSKYEFGSKEEAKKFWTDCCFNSEGSEQNRYLNILSQIEAGETYVTDGSDDRVPSGKNIYKDYSDVKKKGAYKVFNGYKNPSKGDYTPKYKSYKLANEGRLSTAEGWLQFFNGHNLARSKSTWNEFKQEMLAAGREEELNKIKEELEKGYGVKLDEAEEEFKPNGVVDDIKKRGDGDLDVTSPIELNTGILPIVNVDQYSRQELFYDEESLMNDVNGDGSEILEPGDEGYYEITTEMIDDATMRYAPPVIEEYINSVLPGSSVKATKMYHPKYYNYGGDELEFTVTFDPAKYNELEEKTVADPEFKNYLKEHYSSYSGFISYLADNLDEFYQQDGWKRFVQVIMFNLRNEEDEMRSAEDSMWESIIGNIG